jgi:membrane-bound lytic murein transglycosylase A
MISHTGSLRFEHATDCRKPLATAVVGVIAALLLAACTTTPAPLPPSIRTLTQARYEAVPIPATPAVADRDLDAAWPALLATCRGFEGRRRDAWADACATAAATADTAARRAVLAQRFDLYRVSSVTVEDGVAEPRVLATETRGHITGYYEPQLNGSRTRTGPFTVPLHRPPADLLTIDLSPLYPDLADRRLRGRLVRSDKGARVVPYWSRAELTEERLRGAELLWVDDRLDAFFLQIQGSGRVRLPDGSVIRVGYADTNGHPYRSIGRVLVERGELTLDQATMPGIIEWARANPRRADELLDQNPSYVFFRELPLGNPDAGPIGAFGVPLVPGYSVAIDPRFIPLGAPLVIRSEHPATGAPLARLVLAHDTGGAIRGPLRFDLFWGFGAEAALPAGRQRHDAEAWLLVPRGVRPEALLAR